jgi:predicted RNA-binding protein Jag
MLPEEVKDVAQRIGQFYLRKNDGDYKATQEEILKLRISKLEITDKGVAITTERPGILIGKRGTNIDALSSFLAMEVRIIEDRDPLITYLLPFEEH